MRRGGSMASEVKGQVRLIKRYGNRKLYDVEASRYVTLDGIRALVQTGSDVRVVDNDSGEDLTRVTLAQIIYEAERKPNGGTSGLSLPLLRRLVQVGDEAVRDLRRGVERGREALESVREAAEQRVQRLVGGRGAKRRKGHSLFEELLEAPQRTLDELQHRIDAQVRQSVERVTSHPALRREITRIEHSLRQLEARIGKIAQGGKAKPAARAKRKKTSP
jgi:polyhydroxyalkanoate synthesis repressor PhaR